MIFIFKCYVHVKESGQANVKEQSFFCKQLDHRNIWHVTAILAMDLFAGDIISRIRLDLISSSRPVRTVWYGEPAESDRHIPLCQKKFIGKILKCVHTHTHTDKTGGDNTAKGRRGRAVTTKFLSILSARLRTLRS